MKRKFALVVTIILLAVGFAAISTTLIINGNTRIGENSEDFSVIFTSATLDGTDVYNDVIDDTKKVINFSTSELKELNQASTLTYEITNNSSNYDAEVSVNCKAKDNTTTKYTSIKNELEGNATKVLAREKLSGTITIILEKLVVEEVSENYVCTIDANAVEKENVTKNNLNITKTGTDIGDQVCIDTECFYIYDKNDEETKLISKYNLYVGGDSYGNGGNYNAYEGETNMQDSTMLGFNKTKPYKGGTAFSNNVYVGQKHNSYDGSVVNHYVDIYKDKLTNIGLSDFDVRLISFDELVSLGCNETSETCTTSNKEFVYSTSYWTSSPLAGDDDLVYYVAYDGTFGYLMYNSKIVGVRPVLIVKSSLLK